ncbi:MAG: hypothetical protein CR975_05355 [Gammaproteobacteria bacterium]|nr:MAG: hypothetical protein CR975_05355 [Gammaproteobacteria bacterium]
METRADENKASVPGNKHQQYGKRTVNKSIYSKSTTVYFAACRHVASAKKQSLTKNDTGA